MQSISELLAFYKEFPDWAGQPCEIDRPNNYSDFPIHVAATRGRIDEIEILLLSGANINERGEAGSTPLGNAVEQGHSSAVRYLLEHGADTTIANDDGDTALDLAEYFGDREVIELLHSGKAEN